MMMYLHCDLFEQNISSITTELKRFRTVDVDYFSREQHITRPARN